MERLYLRSNGFNCLLTVSACFCAALCGCQAGRGTSPASVSQLSEHDAQIDSEPESDLPADGGAKSAAPVQVASGRKDGIAVGSNSWSRIFGRLSGPPPRIPLPRTDDESVQTVSGEATTKSVPIDEF